eukprot:6030321-Lingulodinium_polyedra.AAC.1
MLGVNSAHTSAGGRALRLQRRCAYRAPGARPDVHEDLRAELLDKHIAHLATTLAYRGKTATEQS